MTDLMKSSFKFVRNPTNPLKRLQVDSNGYGEPAENNMKRRTPELRTHLIDRIKNIAEDMALKRRRRGTKNPFTENNHINGIEVSESSSEMGEDIVTLQIHASLLRGFSVPRGLIKSTSQTNVFDCNRFPSGDQSQLVSIVLPRSTLFDLISEFEQSVRNISTQPRIEELDSDDEDDHQSEKYDEIMNDNCSPESDTQQQIDSWQPGVYRPESNTQFQHPTYTNENTTSNMTGWGNPFIQQQQPF